MKRYYCPNCREFKHRWQLKREDNTRTAFYTCRWCHLSNIYTTEDIIWMLVDKILKDEDLNSIHGTWE
jgi:RNase P subunit RPR2